MDIEVYSLFWISVKIKFISEAGHADVKTLKIYTHAMRKDIDTENGNLSA